MDEAVRRRRDRVLAAVEALWAAYDADSPEFFALLTDDATVFSLSLTTRLDGREAYRRCCESEPSPPRRATQLLHVDVRLVGDGALVTCHQRIRINHGSVDARATLLLVPDGDLLKVAHLHLSPLAATQVDEAAGLVEEVIAVPAPQVQPPAAPAGQGRSPR
jgi:SnoaL-like protein